MQVQFDDICRQRGGRCVDPQTYSGCESKLTWECAEGHRWTAKWNNVKNGSWCPYCRTKSESFVRACLEHLSGLTLPSSKPNWLRNCGGPRAYYQLDGLSTIGGLAFEYHGPQHYVEVPAFHRAGHSLELQQARDAFVRQACAANGVQLIEVSPLPSTTLSAQIDHIRAAYESIAGPVDDALVRAFHCRPFGKSSLASMHDHARMLGGECLSSMFNGVRTKYIWRCREGHIWKATWSHVKDGRWCRDCGKSAVPTVAMLASTAAARGGICLNPASYLRKEKLRWRCGHGHEWNATWTSVQQGRWCSTCAWAAMAVRFQVQPEQLVSHATSLGGACLNPELYAGNTTKLRWRCREDHEWESTWASVQQDHWCPHCARAETAARQRDSVDLLTTKAALLGGRLVDPESYRNSITPVAWACAEGHTWYARWGDVKRGRWCSACKRESRGLTKPIPRSE